MKDVQKRILKIISVLLLSFMILLTGCKVEKEEKLDSSFKIHFIDVGQADCILIKNGEKSMLIDAGNNNDEKLVVNYLKKEGIKKLDYVIGTHPHEDHIGGLDAVIDHFHIGKIYMPKATHTSKTFKDVIKSIKKKGLKISNPSVGSKILLGDAEGLIVAPNGRAYKNFNDYSIVMRLTYKNTSYLFTGDAEALSEKEILKKGFDISADVLKVGHHGSHSSTIQPFLNKVNPKYAVIMTEKGNDYGHPHKETMDKLKNKGVTVYRTDQNGTIVLTSDGKDIVFNTNEGDYSSPREKSMKESATKESNQKENNSDEKQYVGEKGKGFIKGNINSKGEKIYHMPHGAYYDKVTPEKWFHTESEAKSAGFRKSKR